MKRSNEAEYQAYLATKPEPFAIKRMVKDFGDWWLIENEWPYDLLFKTHHLLIPMKKVTRFRDLPHITQANYHKVLAKLEKDYDTYFVNMPLKRTVATHWHCHIIRWHE